MTNDDGVGAKAPSGQVGTELLFEKILQPPLIRLSGLLGPGSFLHRLLIGTLVEGRIDFMQSFGILTSGLFIPLGVVLPYLLSFYFVLSLLEDSGYLPRVAFLMDALMHKLGLQSLPELIKYALRKGLIESD